MRVEVRVVSGWICGVGLDCDKELDGDKDAIRLLRYG